MNFPADSQFDVISIIHVLEHVVDPAALLKRCRELMRPNAWIYLAVPNDSPLGHYKCFYGSDSELIRRHEATSIEFDCTPAFASVDA